MYYLKCFLFVIPFGLGLFQFTLNEILQYAKTGIIAFNTSAQHVPPALKLDTGGDIKKFSMNKADDFQHLQFFETSCYSYSLGTFLTSNPDSSRKSSPVPKV